MLSLPIIDLKSFSSENELAVALLGVGKDPGFFYVVGHDIGDAVAQPIFDLTSKYFATPVTTKMAFHDGSGDLGYTGLREETLSGSGLGDVKESFYLSDPGKGKKQSLPIELEENRLQMASFFAASQDLAHKLLRGLSIGLGMPADFLSNAHNGECFRMRLISYPSIPTNRADDFAGDDIRAGQHTDYGSLTLLFRQVCDEGGLQVRVNETWLDIPCLKDAIVVNIGDALEFWSAGRLRSTVHRVAFPRSAGENVQRLSIPVFIQPDPEVLLSPLGQESVANMDKSEEFMDVLRRKGYTNEKPVTSKEHLTARKRATYITA